LRSLRELKLGKLLDQRNEIMMMIMMTIRELSMEMTMGMSTEREELLEVRFIARLKIRMRKLDHVNLGDDLMHQEIHLDPEMEIQEMTVEEEVAVEVAFHHEGEVVAEEPL